MFYLFFDRTAPFSCLCFLCRVDVQQEGVDGERHCGRCPFLLSGAVDGV